MQGLAAATIEILLSAAHGQSRRETRNIHRLSTTHDTKAHRFSEEVWKAYSCHSSMNPRSAALKVLRQVFVNF